MKFENVIKVHNPASGQIEYMCDHDGAKYIIPHAEGNRYFEELNKQVKEGKLKFIAEKRLELGELKDLDEKDKTLIAEDFDSVKLEEFIA